MPISEVVYACCKNEPFLMRQVIAGTEIQSEAGLYTDHSGESEDRKQGCLSAIDSVPYFELWYFISPNLD